MEIETPRLFIPFKTNRPTQGLPLDQRGPTVQTPHGIFQKPSHDDIRRALPLEEASGNGQLDKVDQILQESKLPPRYLDNALYSAAGAGDAAVAEELLRNGARIDPMTISPAVESGSISLLQVFLDHGWNINEGGYDRCVPLQIALKLLPKNPDETLVRFLLKNGADPNLGHGYFVGVQALIPNSGSALNAAANCASIPVFDLLIEHGAKLEYCIPLHSAVKSLCPDSEVLLMVKHLLDIGVDVNALDDVEGPYRRGTALHCAVVCSEQSIERIKFLLANGADPNVRNHRGRSALEQARKERYACSPEIVELLE